MRLHRFYIDTPISKDSFDISDKELAYQWRTVFRYNVGSQVILFDGLGHDFLCLISSLRNLGATVSVVRKMKGSEKSKREVTLCLALIKKDNFELVVQKATELGVARIIPVLCERSEKKNLNMDRLRKIAIESSEQSGRGDVPKIEECIDFVGLLDGNLLPDTVVSLNLEGSSVAEIIKKDPKSIAVFVGPEGGFSEKEVKEFTSHNIIQASLGSQVLRAETAAVAVSSLLLL